MRALLRLCPVRNTGSSLKTLLVHRQCLELMSAAVQA